GEAGEFFNAVAAYDPVGIHAWPCRSENELLAPLYKPRPRRQSMTLLFSDPIFLNHDTGSHPETAERLRAIERRLAADGLLDRVQRGSFEPLTPEEITAVHGAEVVERVRRTAERGGGFLDVDTVVSPASFAVG